MYKNYSSDDEQLTLNVSNIKVTLAESLKTQQVRLLIYMLTAKKLSAHEISTLARSQQPEVLYQQGRLIICPSPKKKVGRYWLWDVFFAPSSYLAA